jgi:hypothetical protein
MIDRALERLVKAGYGSFRVNRSIAKRGVTFKKVFVPNDLGVLSAHLRWIESAARDSDTETREIIRKEVLECSKRIQDRSKSYTTASLMGPGPMSRRNQGE